MELWFVGDWLPRAPLVAGFVPGSCRLVGNLECAIAANTQPSGKAHPLILGPDSVSHVAAARFAALSLANNHVYDAGKAGFGNMLRVLRERCETQFYGLKEAPYAVLEVNGSQWAVIGCLERCRARGPGIFREEDVLELIASLRGRFHRVVVTPHWGKEGEFASHPSPRQRTLARRWIEAGADAVLGHHPHTIHGVEFFRDRPVYYSLGNFVFDHEEGRTYDCTRLGMAIQWSAGHESQTDHWQRHFLLQEGNLTHVAYGSDAHLAEDYLAAISHDLVDAREPWSRLRWAKAVGPVYIAKCRRSWRRRLSRRPLATTPLWLLWNVLPSTLLLRYGSLFPNRRGTAAAERLAGRLAGGRGCVSSQVWSSTTGSEIRTCR